MQVLVAGGAGIRASGDLPTGAAAAGGHRGPRALLRSPLHRPVPVRRHAHRFLRRPTPGLGAILTSDVLVPDNYLARADNIWSGTR